MFLKALYATGLWQPLDPENILMPIDYRVIRLSLRNGAAVCLGAEDESLRTLLEPNIVTIHY